MTSTRKKFKWQVDNGLRGAYAETDFDKKVVKVNKRRHKSKGASRISKNKDGSEKLIDTLVHENEHIRDPREDSEGVIKRRAARKVKKMSRRQKNRFYSKI